MKTVTVYLVRHGQTYFNRYNRMQGWSDSPLTPKGIADAHTAGKRLQSITFDHCYSSDRGRAIHTAEILLSHNINTHIPFSQTELFREEFYGYFEGEDAGKTWVFAGSSHGTKTYEDIIKEYSLDATKDFLNEVDATGDAESATEYWTRLAKGFKWLREQARDGDKVLMVSHGTTIRSIVDKFGEKKFDIMHSPLNGSITTIQLTEEGITVLDYNNSEGDIPE
ncbi:phosphoglycerate mutase family protein [Agrilactobacillus composti DSM 18527 = JCM 14202]|uniref:phosphoglycerate mutase (2,3-diphosphoglycerate-dependent) n=1 Tax=Agrilactobacillus composti DSM 18527 = JCM 14202 TaxID=1423734 RepID=X0QSW1_9LACO|nr:histidine phosphatase family protein [Agrilactobacillus composti]KRM34396.1 phosphoglycerate mutase family protein [Agrilactobacillus composti DSM 18527 = JCM 14202]GAF41695.1 phosphoglycerate mutase family [Agrilactobacillus composti DSM 18527 = JCM 14202]